MKIKIGEAMEARTVFAKLVDEKMPLKTSYNIMKIINRLDQESSFFDKKMSEILEECGEKNEDGTYIFTDSNSIKIKEGREADARERLEELNSIEVELPDMKFNLEDFANLSLSPRELYAINNFIEE